MRLRCCIGDKIEFQNGHNETLRGVVVAQEPDDDLVVKLENPPEGVGFAVMEGKPQSARDHNYGEVELEPGTYTFVPESHNFKIIEDAYKPGDRVHVTDGADEFDATVLGIDEDNDLLVKPDNEDDGYFASSRITCRDGRVIDSGERGYFVCFGTGDTATKIVPPAPAAPAPKKRHPLAILLSGMIGGNPFKGTPESEQAFLDVVDSLNEKQLQEAAAQFVVYFDECFPLSQLRLGTAQAYKGIEAHYSMCRAIAASRAVLGVVEPESDSDY